MGSGANNQRLGTTWTRDNRVVVTAFRQRTVGTTVKTLKSSRGLQFSGCIFDLRDGNGCLLLGKGWRAIIATWTNLIVFVATTGQRDNLIVIQRTIVRVGSHLLCRWQHQRALATLTVEQMTGIGGAQLHHELARTAATKVLLLRIVVALDRIKMAPKLLVEQIRLGYALIENLDVLGDERLQYDLTSAFTGADQLELVFECSAELRFGQLLKAHRIVAAPERQAESGRREAIILLFGHVLTLDDLGDVVGNGGIGADPVFVHERDQIRLVEQQGCLSAALLKEDTLGHEHHALLKGGNHSRIPGDIRIDIEKVAFTNH
mmetsp:Transcript_44615/g.112423  ORF Transcript_44615/g.112423 Transcript_44615/m.112423 type:complete len:319 (+) Transcript_44615:1276-2232(+)